MKTDTLTLDQQFFHDNAGFSYDPRTETPEQGRIRGAIALAEAERVARNSGCFYEWDVDPDCDDTLYPLYSCVMRDADHKLVGCLGGINFGPEGSPCGDPYKRVVEAELACEWHGVAARD